MSILASSTITTIATLLPHAEVESGAHVGSTRFVDDRGVVEVIPAGSRVAVRTSVHMDEESRMFFRPTDARRWVAERLGI